MTHRRHVVEVCKKIFSSQDIDLIKRLKGLLVKDGRFTIKEFQSFRIIPATLLCLDNQRLYYLAEAIDECFPGEYNLIDAFSPEDLSEPPKSESDEMLLDFANGYELAPEQWSAMVSVSQLAELLRTQKIALYRDERADKATSDLVYLLKPNSNRANEIAELIAEDRFKYNTIRFNVIRTSSSKSPHLTGGRLVIPEGQDIIMPDGYNRAVAAEIAYVNHPELHELLGERFFNVIVTYLSPDDTRRLIAQELHRERVDKVMLNGIENGATNTIIEMIKNGKAGENCAKALNSTEIAEAVSDSLDRYMHTFKMRTEWQISRTANWLSQYYNFVSETFPEAFSKADPWVWYAVTCYASMIKEDKDWKELTKLGVDLIDLDNLPISNDVKETEIEILKRCKGACCKSVEQKQKREVR